LKLTALQRQGYGVGAITQSLANTVVIFFFAKFLVDEAGLEPWMAGAVLFVGKAWDAITDPVVGRMSDHTRSPMGSRRVWLAWSVLPFAVLFSLLWQVFPLEGAAAAGVYLALLVTYNTVYTCYVVPYGALVPVLTDDYDERTRLNGARMSWAMVGGLVSAILMPMLREATGSYSTGAVLVAVLMVPPALLMLYSTRGRDRVAPVATSDHLSMWSVLEVRSFRRVAVLFLAAWSSISVLGALMPFYVQDHLRRPDLEDGLFAVLQISALVAIPGVLWVSHKLQKHRAYGLLIGTWAISLMGLAIVPADRWDIALVVAGLVGPGVAAGHVLPWAMLPDVVEADRLENGVERAGAFYGVMTFLEKVATAFALQAMLLGLQFAGYDRTLEVQTDLARTAMVTMIGPIPAVVLLLAAVYAVLRPPLTRDEHAELLLRLKSQ